MLQRLWQSKRFSLALDSKIRRGMEFWLYAATTSALLTSLIGCAGGNASPSNVAQLRPQSGTVVWFVEGATNQNWPDYHGRRNQ